MNLSKTQQQVLALAAVVQGAQLIYELGAQGSCDEMAFATNINSIYSLDAPDFETIYGDIDKLKLGLEALVNILQQKAKSKTSSLISRYTFDIIFLQHKLMKNHQMLKFMRQRIQQATNQKEYFGEINDTILENLADIYSGSLSQMRYKVQIIGKAEYMRNPKVFNKVRALLLSSIRASVLWQQMGGSKWQLFFSRNKILKQAELLLNK